MDGLQRLSTIFSFMNKLREENGEIREPFLPEATKYLPALKGIQWETEGSSNSLSNNLKLLFKRQKISVNIIERESDDEAKLELFQRLNTGGSTLTPQEVRNCLLIMLNSNAFDFIQNLTKYPSFQRTVLVTESKEEQAYYYELVLRFFINRYASDEARSRHSDVHPYLNEETIRLFDTNSSFDYVNEKEVFHKTFDNIALALDEDAFKKYKTEKDKYEGGFSLPVFEALSTSVSFLVDKSLDENLIREIIVNKSKELVENEDFKRSYSSRLRPIDRTKRMINIGRSLFCED